MCEFCDDILCAPDSRTDANCAVKFAASGIILLGSPLRLHSPDEVFPIPSSRGTKYRQCKPF